MIRDPCKAGMAFTVLFIVHKISGSYKISESLLVLDIFVSPGSQRQASLFEQAYVKTPSCAETNRINYDIEQKYLNMKKEKTISNL